MLIMDLCVFKYKYKIKMTIDSENIYGESNENNYEDSGIMEDFKDLSLGY